jgi:uncharacterized phage protein gp47/JayE
MSGPYRDPTLNELREKYEQRIAELEASIVEHMDVERKAEVRAEKQKQRIAELEAVLREALEVHSHEDVAWTDDAVAALRDSCMEGHFPVEEDT